MGLTIGVRFIKGGKSKIVVIISKIRGRNAYRVEQRSLGPTGDLGEGNAIGSKTGESYAGDRIRDESSGKATNVEESSTSSR